MALNGDQCATLQSSPCDVQVEDWQYLPVVGHQCLAYQLARQHQLLQQLQAHGYHCGVTCVEGGLDGDDQLRNDR